MSQPPTAFLWYVFLVLLVYSDLRDSCLQGHGCVPLDELFLTAPTGGRIGDPRRLALRKEIAFRSRKPRPCAYASWQTPYLCFYVQSRFQLCSGLRMRSSQRTLASGGVHWGLFRSRKTRPCAYASLQTPYLCFTTSGRPGCLQGRGCVPIHRSRRALLIWHLDSSRDAHSCTGQ